MSAKIRYSLRMNQITLFMAALLISGMLCSFTAASLCAAPTADSVAGDAMPGSDDAMVCKGFLPPNDLSIPVDSRDASGINEAQFNAVLDSLERLYAPIVAEQGGVLEIRRFWTDATVNASAQRLGKNYILSMYGGLARHAAITMDGFALVACHELGHHLGGAPKKSGTWATNEGQADYYANLKCLRRVFSYSPSSDFTRSAAGDEVAQKSCEQQFPDAAERALCVRNALAGKSLATLLMALHKETVEPRFDTPDPAVASVMMDVHPPTQCRLDTYLQGALCTQPAAAGLSDTDPAAGTCTRSGGFTAGLRPLCWYKPSSPEEALALLSVSGDAGADRIPAEPGHAFSVLQSKNPWLGF